MKENYQSFVERMISKYEGSYGWDRADAGGPTKYGITCYDLAQHRHQRMDSMARWAAIVRAMTLSEADDIYRSKYASACCFDQLDAGCDCVIFDFGVNSGPSRSIKYAQQVVHVGVDGVLGPQTLEAINNHDNVAFINGLCDERMRFLRKLRNWGTFGRGWSSRVRDLRAYSLHLVPSTAHGVMGAPLKVEKHTEKELRIPKAFGKAYGAEELQEIEGLHGSNGTSGEREE